MESQEAAVRQFPAAFEEYTFLINIHLDLNPIALLAPVVTDDNLTCWHMSE